MACVHDGAAPPPPLAGEGWGGGGAAIRTVRVERVSPTRRALRAQRPPPPAGAGQGGGGWTDLIKRHPAPPRPSAAGVLHQIPVRGLFVDVVFFVVAMAFGGVEGNGGCAAGALVALVVVGHGLDGFGP